MKRFVLTLLAIIFLLLLPRRVLADNEFTTAYHVTFAVGSNGTTTVTENITLKNLTDQYYASNLSLVIGSTSIFDISANDQQGGVLETSIDKKGTKTSIRVKFGSQVVGRGKEQQVILTFKSNDFAENIGKTWQVSLPRAPESSGIESYDVLLSVPQSFGDPTSISPTPRFQSGSLDRINFSYDKSQLSQSGVSASFGTMQTFSYTLNYHLENNQIFPIITDVSLPPSTNYQDVTVESILPRPENVTEDEDGNLLAWFKLGRGEKVDVKVLGFAKLYINPTNKSSNSRKEQGKVNLRAQEIREYTKTDKYWSKDEPLIKAKLADIFKKNTPGSNREKVRMIYRYVVDNLKYSTSRLSGGELVRLGAVTALQNPDAAVCMEFTDLFVALTRSMGIPSREVDGYPFTKNKELRPVATVQNGKVKDFLHAWPEYFDENKGWVMVDPTWENTSGGVDYFNKFDLNHFSLVIKGSSSELPTTSDDVKVELSEKEPEMKPKIDVSIEILGIPFLNLPKKAVVKIQNNGNFSLGPSSLILTTGQLIVLGSRTVDIDSLPAYGSKTLDFNLRAPSIWSNINDNLEVKIAGTKVVRSVSLYPVFANHTYWLIAAGSTLGVIYLVILSIHIYHKRLAKKV